ncbi:MAG: hypothetical protein RLZZ400_679 [Actinomycetota bacterium]|jgi:hypothetical protein
MFVFERMLKLIAILAACCLSLLAVSEARGDDFGTNTSDTGPFADDASHTWCEGHLNYVPSWFDPMQDAMDNLDSQTDMTTGAPTSCYTSTDIWYDVYGSSVLGLNVRGRSMCRVALTVGTVCGSFIVQLNSDLLSTYSSRRKTACHEIGHTVGLSHSSILTSTSDCMISGDYTFHTLNSHHVSHINSKY